MIRSTDPQSRLKRASEWTQATTAYYEHNNVHNATRRLLNTIADIFPLELASTQRHHLTRAIAATVADPIERESVILELIHLLKQTGPPVDHLAGGLPWPPRDTENANNINVAEIRNSVMKARPRARLVILLAACAGLRPRDLSKLHTRDIDHARCALSFQAGPVAGSFIPLHPVLLLMLENTPTGWIFFHRNRPERRVRTKTLAGYAARYLPRGVALEDLAERYALDLYSSDDEQASIVTQILGPATSETDPRKAPPA